MNDTRQLKDLSGIGPAMMRDFEILGVRSVDELSDCDPRELYERLCVATGERKDPCCEDVFRCAVAQARNPHLPAEQRNWWYWTKVRKARAARA